MPTVWKSSSQKGAPPRSAGVVVAMRALRQLEAPRLPLWSPVCVAFGASAAFGMDGAAASALPRAVFLVGLSLAAAGAALTLRDRGGLGSAGLRVLLAGIALALLGGAAAERRIHHVDAPIWADTARGERGLDGRIVAVGRSTAGAPRLTLDRLRIDGVAAQDTPRRILLTFNTAGRSAGQLDGHHEAALDQDDTAAWVAMTGRRIWARARLSPPPGPAEPGAFDYRFRAFFKGVGAVGRISGGWRDLGPALTGGAWDAAAARVADARRTISLRARAAAPGREGAVIAALLVGDRSGVPASALQDLRDSNLAHLLAISGLHMAMACLSVFALVRVAAAATPLSAGLAPKKIAAIAALCAGAAYLTLSGGGVPSERAFVMAAVAFGAVLVDRPPVTLRAVALAALLMLLWRPESLFDAGFQLSFAATTAMVAVFETARGWFRAERAPRWPRAVGLWAGALLVSSATAGAATAPFAALAFNRLSRYGLLANLAAVPAMGLVVMPLGVAAVCLTPIGLDTPVYQVMALGVRYVLAVAEAVAALPAATRTISAAPPEVGALLALGGLCACLWRAWALKAIGALPLAAALWLWSAAERPDLLISPGGRLIGVAGEEGRAFDRDVVRRARYAASLWLRRDGDPAALEEAARRRRFAFFRTGAAARLPEGWRVERFDGRLPPSGGLSRLCRGTTVVIAPWARRAEFSAAKAAARGAPCLIFDAAALQTAGAVAIWTPEPGRPPKIWRAGGRGPDRPWRRARQPE